MRVSEKIINSDDPVFKWLEIAPRIILVKTVVLISFMPRMFGLDAPNWVSVCVCYDQFFFFFTDDLLCPAQPDSSICVGVFLHGLWKMSKLLVCLLRYGQCSFLSASAAN